MEKRKRFVAFLLISLMLTALLFTGCGAKPATETSAQGETTAAKVVAKQLKFGIAVSENSTWYEGAVKFGEIIEEKTEGRYVVDFYPSDQLAAGNIIKGLESVQMGATDIDMRSSIIYSTIDPKFSIPLMPWLIPSYEEADAALEGAGGEMLFDLLRQNGVEPLAFGESGYRQITNSKTPIQSIADMNNLKIRVPSMKMFISLFTTLGADPTSINFGELFAALQQRTVDGQENPPDVIASAKIQEAQKYMTIWNASYDPIIMVASQSFWATLNETDQKIFADAAVEAMAYQKELARAKNEELVEEFKANMEIIELTPEQMAEFRVAAQPVYDEYEELVGIEILEAFGYKKN
ncbi:MAG: DctP family TRAP transporter solute-binding subunit [Tissierellales bacterium]|nr:DctP family TRAP transporter solute-binding subunit [Tissierellales bacterium]MBN2826866.1 DctP family TRAP transporter solute-binding subunit [Tissierellales bacterium]